MSHYCRDCTHDNAHDGDDNAMPSGGKSRVVRR